MLLSEQFKKDDIGKLLIETKSVKIKKSDKENVVKAISGDLTPFVLESYPNANMILSKIGEIICFEFSEQYNELAEYIIETCDELGYKIIGDIDNENIKIKVIK